MESWQEQYDFFMANWPGLRVALEDGGALAGIGWIEKTFTDDLERRVMYAFAKQGLYDGDWEGRNLDLLVSFGDAGIAEMLRQAGAAKDDETRRADQPHQRAVVQPRREPGVLLERRV
jgi:hypothetical protein